MHPATSVILFTVMSGAGFGLLFLLDLGLVGATGLGALPAFATGFVLAGGGLLASTFHLGNPQRAIRAFSQWRTSWLSREGIASLAALALNLPVAYGAAGGQVPTVLGLIAAAACAATVYCTAMIYAQLATVPRWHHWTTILSFLAFALTGGAILSAKGAVTALPCLLLAGVMVVTWRLGDRRFAAAGSSIGAATGLAGSVRAFAPPHTGPNYVTREMIHQVGRRHATRLRVLALLFAALLPAAVLVLLPAGLASALPAFVLHLAGALAQRWLFFAEAEHVVGHYYCRAPA